MRLELVEKRRLTTSEIFVYKGFGYVLEKRIWDNGASETIVEAKENPLFSPDIEVVENDSIISININYIKPENAHKVIEGINNAIKFCEAVKELDLKKSSAN